MNNYFYLEALIKERLINRVTQINPGSIFSAADLEGVKEAAQVTPALHVIFFDDEPGNTADLEYMQKVTQLWAVVLVTKNVRNVTGEAARDTAGAVILNLLQALQGWVPDEGFSPLRRRKAPFRASQYKSGFLYSSFLFATSFLTNYQPSDEIKRHF